MKYLLALIFIPSLSFAFDCKDLANRKAWLVKMHKINVKLETALGQEETIEASGYHQMITDDAFIAHMSDLKDMEDLLGCK